MDRKMVEQIVKEMFFTGELQLGVEVSSEYTDYINVRVSILDSNNNELEFANCSTHIEK